MKILRKSFNCWLVVLFGVGIFFVGCIPSHLRKYKNTSPKSSSAKSAPVHDLNTEIGADSIDLRTTRSSPAKPEQKTVSSTGKIYAIDNQTFRFRLPEKDIWDSTLDVLLRNYNLNIVDRASGIITTDWDTYYLNDAVFRNKISIRIQRTSRSFVDVTIHNSVEKLREGSTVGSLATIWLPSDDVAKETSRIVQNIAIIMNEPPPLLNISTATSESEMIRR